MSILPIAAVLAGAGLVWLGMQTLHASKRRKRAREHYFMDVQPLFEQVSSRTEPSGFARLSGRIGADTFDLQALPDSLSFRKLPALWVMVTLPVPQPVKATLDIMARPGGLETFSHFNSLRYTLPPLAGLPEGIVIRSDNASEIPPPEQIEPHLGLFADPRVKELVISPKGLRLVILAEEAERGRYLIFRDSELGLSPLAAERLKPLIDTLLALRDTLRTAA